MTAYWINAKFDMDTGCTNIEYATGNKPVGDNWIAATAEDVKCSRATQLYMQAGTRYFGYM